MNNQDYWNKFKNKINQEINNDEELKLHFNPISNVQSDAWLNLPKKNKIPLITFSFNIANACPRLDIYFDDDKYNLKESRNEFLKLYNEKYLSDGLTIFDDNEMHTQNPACRCTFKMSNKISEDDNGFDIGIEWQIQKLKDVYKHVIELNKNMIIDCKYISNNQIGFLLTGFELWLNEPSSGITTSVNAYISTIKNKGEECAIYVHKSSIIDLDRNDCDNIADKIKEIFPSVPESTRKNYPSHFRKFGEYLDRIKDYLKNGEITMKPIQTEIINKILEENKQVILTGAPGTGKTYAVKAFVKKATQQKNPGGRWTLVQFHPSYDYSDFVEGLKPVPDPAKSGNMFVRIDGCFKEFCRKIVMHEIETIAGIVPPSDTATSESTSVNSVEENEDDLNRKREDAFGKYQESHKKEEENIEELTEEDKEKYENQYYFVIDEINRADLSKVFGEIMYCLDEDYRGPQNAIQTQYSKLETYYKDNTGKFVTYGFDCFENGFFIPYNLHIIGTMNDIDRSVESFDFALRRRFMWKEVDANGSLDELSDMFKVQPTEIDKLINIAKEINDLLISEKYKKLGLTRQFFLGKAYYKSFNGTQESLDGIYDNKIEPIIKEYTRGRDSKLVGDLLKEIKEKLDEVLVNNQSSSIPASASETNAEDVTQQIIDSNTDGNE